MREFSSLADALVVKGLLRCRCKRRAFTSSSKKKSTAAALAFGTHGAAPHSAHARWERLSLVGLGWARLPGCQGGSVRPGFWGEGGIAYRALATGQQRWAAVAASFRPEAPIGCSLQPRTTRTTRTSLVAAKHLTDPTEVVIHQRTSTVTPKPTHPTATIILGRSSRCPLTTPKQQAKPSQATPSPANMVVSLPQSCKSPRLEPNQLSSSIY